MAGGVERFNGTMSAAELHIIRARLDGGIRNKAARGELRRGLPVGFVWGEADGEVLFHPDEAVCGAIRAVFERFAELGSARRFWLRLRSEALSFPLQSSTLAQIRWVAPTYTAIHNVLTNPVYPGAYAYGKGGLITELDVHLPHSNPPPIRTDEDTVDLVRRLAIHYPDAVIAGILNRQGRKSARGERFTAGHVGNLRRYRKIPCIKPPAEPPQGEPVTIRELFEQIDRPALRPLPAQPYEFAEWKKVRANIKDLDYPPPARSRQGTDAAAQRLPLGPRGTECDHYRTGPAWARSGSPSHWPRRPAGKATRPCICVCRGCSRT
jgi:hypothetical protein